MKSFTEIALASIATVALVVGCTPALRNAAVDHAVVTRVVVGSCKSDGDKSKCTGEDLEAIAKQAECLAASLSGGSCE